MNINTHTEQETESKPGLEVMLFVITFSSIMSFELFKSKRKKKKNEMMMKKKTI